jgi:hypothetical protein
MNKSVLALCALGLLGLSQPAYAQFADNCSDATEINGTGTYFYDLSSATNDGAGTCGATATAQDVWMTFQSTISDVVTIETCGLAGHDSVLEAWDACGGNVLACNDDFCGLQSTIQFPVTAGVPVRIRVADFAGGVGSGSIRIFFPGTEVNASGFADPDRINQGGSTLFSVIVEPATIPPSTGITARVDLSAIGGSATQTLFDDGTNGDPAAGDNVFNFAYTTPGNVTPSDYLLPFHVQDAQGRSVDADIFLTILPPAPDNDSCSTPHAMGEGTFNFDTTSATNDGSVSGTCGGSDGSPDVWVRYTPVLDGLATFDLCGSGFDTVVNVWTDCPSSGGTMIACNDDACGLQSRTSALVTGGTPVLVRLAGFFGDFGAGTLTITHQPVGAGGPADDCAAAVATGDGVYIFDTASATNAGDVFGTCGASDGAPDLWIRYTPPASGNATADTCGSGYDTVLNVWSACPGAGGTMIACLDDSCGLQTTLVFGVTQGVDVWVRIAGFAGSSGAGAITLTGPQPPPPGSWIEQGEAGMTLSDAQSPVGNGPLNAIFGNIPTGSDADLYNIVICDQATFSATTINSDTTGDTQLFVFNEAGLGVVHNDDDPLGVGGLRSRLSNFAIQTPGTYYLGVSRYDFDPIDEAGQQIWADTPFGAERTPDGPGAANALAAWSGLSGTGAYRVDLTGACFPGGGPPCDPDYNQDGNVDQDDVAYLVNVIAGGPNPTGRDPDFNGDGNIDQDDYRALVDVVAGGPCP